MSKVAIIGSAPSSIALAPYNDPEWRIWGCSPGAATKVPRADLWFEIHRWEPDKPWFDAGYINKMNSFDCPILMIEHRPELPKSMAYPKDAILERFAPYASYNMTSSVAWMIALAVYSGATEIGIWGVDMSHASEWEFQRSGCHYWICRAIEEGIKVTVPPESDLMQPPTLYGFREAHPMHIKLMSRRQELEPRIAELEAGIQRARDEYHHLKGAMDDLVYQEKTWVSDTKALELIGRAMKETGGTDGWVYAGDEEADT